MQRNFGLQGWLKVPLLYNLLQDAIGGNALRRRFIRHHVRAKPGDKVIDIGCGPAQILPWLPEVDYLGLDINGAAALCGQARRRGAAGVHDTGQVAGGLHVEAEVDHVHQHLHVPLSLHVAAHYAEGEKRFSASENHSWNEGVEWALAR